MFAGRWAHKPRLDSIWPRQCRAIAPENGIACDEVGEGGGEEDQPGEDTDDVEGGDAVAFRLFCFIVDFGGGGRRAILLQRSSLAGTESRRFHS